MSKINPYLNFAGNTEEAFNFYKTIFGGDFLSVNRFKDDPEMNKVTEDELDKIMHIALPIGNGNFLMGTDTLESMGQTLTPGNNFYISISADSKEEADRIFDGLSEGGEIEMPLQNTSWGAYFGSTTDKYGIKWMVDFDNNQTT